MTTMDDDEIMLKQVRMRRMSVALMGMLRVMPRGMLVMAMTRGQTHTYVYINGSLCVWMYICMYVGMTVCVCTCGFV